jgi:hypothetical protein
MSSETITTNAADKREQAGAAPASLPLRYNLRLADLFSLLIALLTAVSSVPIPIIQRAMRTLIFGRILTTGWGVGNRPFFGWSIHLRLRTVRSNRPKKCVSANYLGH